MALFNRQYAVENGGWVVRQLIAKNVLREPIMSRRILGTAIVTAAALAVAPAQAKDLGAVTALQQTNTLAKSFLKH